MVVKIELPPEVEAEYAAEAAAKGLPLEIYLRDRLVEQAPSAPAMTGAERAAALRAWAESHPPGPPLSEEAMSRASFYGKRG